jgi:hypothetical protein
MVQVWLGFGVVQVWLVLVWFRCGLVWLWFGWFRFGLVFGFVLGSDFVLVQFFFWPGSGLIFLFLSSCFWFDSCLVLV